jgi:hypothetical protein
MALISEDYMDGVLAWMAFWSLVFFFFFVMALLPLGCGLMACMLGWFMICPA